MKLRTACNRDCPDACGMLATVEDGRVVRIEGDPEHPVTRGFLCYRTSRFLERQYDPERLTTPLIRRGDELVPAGWDEALDRIAATMLRIKSESGPAAILHYRSGGSLGAMKHVTDYFFECFGPVAVKSGDVCNGAGEAAQEIDFGISESNDLFDLRNSRTIVLWGKNPHVSSVHLVPFLRELRQRGARLVMIDPVRHRGADLCQTVLQPRPGGDLALALGVARWLYDRRRVDPQHAGYCDHADAFRDLVHARAAGDWAEWAGVDRSELDDLAAAYADGPAAILVGWGLQRRSTGAAAVRALDALGAVSGNLGIPGGGVSFYFGRRTGFDLSFSRGKQVAPRTLPEPLLGPAILEAADPAIRMVWVTAGNPVAMLPESDTVERALCTRELTVVVDSWLSDTARAAHVVLPTTTMLEDDDLVGAFGHHLVAEVRPVVPAPDGVRTDYRIARELARRLKLGDEFERDEEHWKRRMMRRMAERGITLETLRRGAARNPLAHEVLFAGRRFPTPSGKVNLLRSIESAEPGTPPAERPLWLLPLATEKTQASQCSPRHQDGPAPATLHPDAAREFEDGDPARLESEIGAMEVRLRFDARQRRDVVIVPKGGWRFRGRCANALVPARATDIGEGACYYETPVRLARVD